MASERVTTDYVKWLIKGNATLAARMDALSTAPDAGGIDAYHDAVNHGGWRNKPHRYLYDVLGTLSCVARDLLIARESVATLTAERDEARRQLAEALARVAPVTDTGDCRTCKWAGKLSSGEPGCDHPDREPDAAWAGGRVPPTFAWSREHLGDDEMTRLPTSPPCPGYTKK